MQSNLLAGAGSIPTEGTIVNPLFGDRINAMLFGGEVSFVSSLISSFITLSFVIGVIVFFFMLIFGAIQWISSGGDKASLETAKGKISNAIIGIVILFSAFAIVKLIEVFFGISILTLDIGPLIIK